MAKPWTELQTILEGVVGAGRKVWFQPPTSTKLTYPCLKYNVADKDVTKADNKLYKLMNQYELTYITRDPADPAVDKLLELDYCDFDRTYIADNLYHSTFTIYY